MIFAWRANQSIKMTFTSLENISKCFFSFFSVFTLCIMDHIHVQVHVLIQHFSSEELVVTFQNNKSQDEHSSGFQIPNFGW